ncbi:MAG: VOC family protein [Nitrospiraceae bacterium]
MVGFETAELDSFVTALKGKSVSVILDIVTTPVCRMAVVEDPDGNHIVIHKRHER